MSIHQGELILFFYCKVVAVSGKNWQQIEVQPKSMLPRTVTLFQSSSVTLYCGTTSLASWSFFSLRDYLQTPIPSRHVKYYNKITLKDLTVEDSGSYYCTGTFRNKTFIDNTYLVVLLCEPNSVPPYIVPSWVEVPLNGSLTLLCGSVTPVEWFSSSFQSVQKSLERNKLKLYNLQKEHSGEYICRGTHKTPPHVSDNKQLSLFHTTAVVIVDGKVNYVTYFTKLNLAAREASEAVY